MGFTNAASAGMNSKSKSRTRFKFLWRPESEMRSGASATVERISDSGRREIRRLDERRRIA